MVNLANEFTVPRIHGVMNDFFPKINRYISYHKRGNSFSGDSARVSLHARVVRYSSYLIL